VAGKGTPATALLTKQEVAHTLHSYTHGSGAAYGPEAAELLGLDPARVFKTLVVEVDGGLAVGVVPVSSSLDLKALAAALGGRKARMAEVDAAQRATGYVAGGISPLGQKKRLPTVLRRRSGRTSRPRRPCRPCSAAPGGAAWRSSSPRPTSSG
jgi:Cys-tRNA(Pro)/Cys-tRNA(Cys) deacylase